MPHVHIHVLPRRDGDFEPNDAIYEAIDGTSQQRNRCFLFADVTDAATFPVRLHHIS